MKDLIYTGEIFNYKDTNYRVIKHCFTPYGFCRDCGKYYIIAFHSHYTKIDKDTKEITKDVDDK